LGHDERKVTAVQVQINDSGDFSFVPSIEVCPSDSNPRTGDHDDIAKELIAATTDRARKLRSLVKLTDDPAANCAMVAEMHVKAVIEWSDDKEVGGEIASVILERGKKWRWFNRPDFCADV
jgi:hypothetical protein